MDAQSFVKTTKTTCPYCGVGCGVLAKEDVDGKITIEGDPDHPANFGKLCSKGSTLSETLGSHDRILYPEIDGKRASWDEALDTVSAKFKSVIEIHGPDAVAFYVSGQFLTEDYYVANKLMKGYIGSGNIDTNSRLCMASSVVGHKRAFGTDSVPGCYEDLEEADLVVLVGSNMAWCHPILFQRILKSKEQNPNKKIIVLDPRETATSDAADLFLPLKPGSDVPIFMGLFNYLKNNGAVDENFVAAHTEGFDNLVDAAQPYTLDQTSKVSGLDKTTLEAFYAEFLKTEKVVTIYSQGVNQSKDGTDKVNAIINAHLLTGRIGKVGAGPFSITGQPNAMGGREVGGLANQLASHLDIDNSEHRDWVQGFWQSPTIATKVGLTAVDMFDAVAEGRIKAIWIMATNPVVSMPNANKVKDALAKCEMVVVSDIYHTSDTAKCADIVLPSTGWGEKDGMVTNSERRMSRQKPFQAGPGEARHDWWQLCEVGRRLGYDGFEFENPGQIFKEYAQLSTFVNEEERDLELGGVAHLSTEEYKNLEPVFWPNNKDYPKGIPRLFEKKNYYTASGKAQFITPESHESFPLKPDYPLFLNTGRIRDQWHTMTRTGRTHRLNSHISEPFIEIHPKDAKAYGVQTAQIAKVSSEYGDMLARVSVTDRQKPGSVFAPMHFTSNLTSKGRVDALAHPLTDPFSRQPAFKSTAVSVTPFKAKWFGYAAIDLPEGVDISVPQNIEYWAKSRAQAGISLELAGSRMPDDWQALFRSFSAELGSVNILVMEGPTKGHVRLAAYDGPILKAVMYVSDRPVIATREWICTQIGQPRENHQKLDILAGIPPKDMPIKGRIICACMDIGANEIITAIEQGCRTVKAIGEKTTAGTNCGSCQGDVRKILEASCAVEA